MIVHTHAQVLVKIRKYTDRFKTFAAAAEAIGCTKAQLTLARTGQQPPCPAILAAIGVERMKVYASGVEDKYREE